ncbi:MAG: hypothetical protein PHO58_04290 [Bacilli bacterium]|nr:hypothetical protein [Candidatus Paceibacterota bacterium]MDD4411700.1 hypothetical protein [Bacilli bacterium]
MEKYFIVIYKSREHFEVLGWEKAVTSEEAKKRFETGHASQIEKYKIKDAVIAEWKEPEDIQF